MGLRGKFLLALVLACLVALLPALLIGQQLATAAREQFGHAYARNLNLLSRERIRAPISRDLALSRQLAGSQLLRQMFLDPSAHNREVFFAEADGLQKLSRGGAYFAISALDLGYYFNQEGKPQSDQPRYHLHRDDPQDSWFFATIQGDRPYNINVNYDAKLHQTRVFINVLVKGDTGKVLGIAGTGLRLDTFLHDFASQTEPGVVPVIVNASGAIQAYRDPARVALNAAHEDARYDQTLASLLPGADPSLLQAVLQDSHAHPDDAVLRTLRFGNGQRLLAVSYLPKLGWYVASIVDLHAAEATRTPWARYLGIGAALVLLVLLAGFGYAVERLLLRPLHALQESAKAIEQGHYSVSLPTQRRDEIGSLSRGFSSMAEQVRAYTTGLEIKVRERTAALEASHAQIVDAHRKIDDSIRYASLLQRAMLPDRELEQALGERCRVLWLPRDVVGGDFYVFAGNADRGLLGVLDCAGHGVPGAQMTMLARSAFDQAVARCGLDDPAQVLQQVDTSLRRLFDDMQLEHTLATNTDAGLICFDRKQRVLRFAGAAMGLYYCDGSDSVHVAGSRRALGDRRTGEYANVDFPLAPGTTWCLVSDGLLDQAGGEHGFGMGTRRFREWLQANADRPLTEQVADLKQTLARYQGSHPQRDDITVLWFRLGT